MTKPAPTPLEAFISRLNEAGHEVPDPHPVAVPAGFKHPEDLAAQIQRLVRTSVSRLAEESGDETFEESEDFDCGDDDPQSPYETYFDPVLGKDLSPAEFREHEQAYRNQYVQAQQRYFDLMDRQRVVQRAHELPARPERRKAAPPAPTADEAAKTAQASPTKA